MPAPPLPRPRVFPVDLTDVPLAANRPDLCREMVEASDALSREDHLPGCPVALGVSADCAANAVCVPEPPNACGAALSLPEGWAELLPFWYDEEFRELAEWLKLEREVRGDDVLPRSGEELAALRACALKDVRVVLLGQDPYPHDAACGPAFSVRRGQNVPASAEALLQELEADGFGPRPGHFDLRPWARRGVLLLNATMTTLRRKPKAHACRGWEALTGRILNAVVLRDDRAHAAYRKEVSGAGPRCADDPGPVPAVFLLLGSWARGMVDGTGPGPLVPSDLRVCAPHPAAREGQFSGSRVFSRVNARLAQLGGAPVDWRLPSGREELLSASREAWEKLAALRALLGAAAGEAADLRDPDLDAPLSSLLDALRGLDGARASLRAAGKLLAGNVSGR